MSTPLPPNQAVDYLRFAASKQADQTTQANFTIILAYIEQMREWLHMEAGISAKEGSETSSRCQSTAAENHYPLIRPGVSPQLSELLECARVNFDDLCLRVHPEYGWVIPLSPVSDAAIDRIVEVLMWEPEIRDNHSQYINQLEEDGRWDLLNGLASDWSHARASSHIAEAWEYTQGGLA